MTLSGRDVLLVGHSFHGAQALTEQLYRWGFQCHLARDMRAAFALMMARPVDLVLSNTHLPDGTGFDLLMSLAGLPVTAFLCLPVENSCFWLPAIDDGKECLGLPALRPSEFASTLEKMARRLAPALQIN
jgi:response regulator RpfG family c-di-GMP phosphodiesterase